MNKLVYNILEYFSTIQKIVTKSPLSTNLVVENYSVDGGFFIGNKIMKSKIIGRRVGKIVIVKYVKTENKVRYFLCKCDCGGEKLIRETDIRKDKTRSCGCLAKENGKKYRKNLVGLKYGNLLVIETTDKKNKDNRILNKCQCDCGSIVFVSTKALTSNNTVRCGKCKLIIKERPDLIEEWDFEKNKKLDINSMTIGSMKKVWWICKNCNYSWEASINSRGKKKIIATNCPKCRRSKGEKLVCEILDKHNYIYERSKKFEGCKDKILLSFDFYLPDYNLCIEYQGEQHYKNMKHWGSLGIKKYEYTKMHDDIKRKFCKNNNIFMLEISYLEKENCEKIILDKIQELKLGIYNDN